MIDEKPFKAKKFNPKENLKNVRNLMGSNFNSTILFLFDGFKIDVDDEVDYTLEDIEDSGKIHLTENKKFFKVYLNSQFIYDYQGNEDEKIMILRKHLGDKINNDAHFLYNDSEIDIPNEGGEDGFTLKDIQIEGKIYLIQNKKTYMFFIENKNIWTFSFSQESSLYDVRKEIEKKMESYQNFSFIKNQDEISKVDEFKTNIEEIAEKGVVFLKKYSEEKKELEKIEDQKENGKELYNKELKIIKKELNKIVKTFCYEEINDYLEINITNFIKHILKSNLIGKLIEKNLIFFFEKTKDSEPNIEHLNIILVGPSGVGKSTLINEILKLNPPIETGFGAPITMKPEAYVSNNIKYLRLIDSRGIERGKDYDLDPGYKDVKDFIEQKIKDNNPDEYVHCIWYCWQGRRLEENEINILKELNKAYYEKIPIIIVYTNAIDNEYIEEANKYIQHMNINNDFEFIPVCAKEYKLYNNCIIKPFNLDTLQKISIKQAKSAITSSFCQGLIEDIKNKIKTKIDELVIKIKENINQEIIEINLKMNEETSIESLNKDCVTIISNIFYKFILLDENIKSKDNDNPKIEIDGIDDFSMSEESLNNIIIFAKNYFKRVFEIYETKFNDFSQRFSDDISKKIIDNQKEISKKAKLIALRISFDSFIIQFIEKFGYNYALIYDEATKEKKYIGFQEKLKFYASHSFDKLEKIFYQCNHKEDESFDEEDHRRTAESILDFD